MAHYAYIDSNNMVVDVIVGKDETEMIEGLSPEIYYARETDLIVKRTSYNTRGNKHDFGGTPFRKNYAGIGYTYDSELDGFIPPQCHEEAVLNKETCLWECANEIHTKTV